MSALPTANFLPFHEHETLHDLKHFLPAQAPLKDFIHHNTLHAFQQHSFFDALRQASEVFGYKVLLSLEEYRQLYRDQKINEAILEKAIVHKTKSYNGQLARWKHSLLEKQYPHQLTPRIGRLRAEWKKQYQLDLDSLVHPILFRTLCSYLDQGISIWGFPVHEKGFLASITALENNSFTSLFRTKKVKAMLRNEKISIGSLLKQLVGEEGYFEQYLYDQQFAHQGWSGMVSTIEDQPHTLIDHKNISLHDLIVVELLLELDALYYKLGDDWKPLAHGMHQPPEPLFDPILKTEYQEVLEIWQNAFEWSYYDGVLGKIQVPKPTVSPSLTGQSCSFQAMFCIDDRECSLRRYVEQIDPQSETFGTPGFFGVEFYYQPEHGKFHTKLCPAPVNPRYLIKEIGNKHRRQKDVHLSKRSHSLLTGWFISQTVGFESAFRLFVNVFRPSMSPATASSLRHMDKFSSLTIEHDPATPQHENGLQVGFTIEEMALRVENLLKSIGLVKDFAPIMYVIGHGSSSVNNPHYAAYDCGACSGRAGSVNARVISDMANRPEVRAILRERGVEIPDTTQFVGGLHDTTRDEIVFYDEPSMSATNRRSHLQNEETFKKALDLNAKERSRRFESIDTTASLQKIHQKILERSVSLFEPRPELNHATNALCVVGRRSLTRGLFLDRRAFMNSYDYAIDPDGKYLLNILKAAAPVCGGINLEYFFSRMDNQKLGAGTKLPHNVMGLFGVANGIDGDLRAGLPSQMIEIHDPVRLMIIVEHFPEVVLKTIQTAAETYEWFANEWVRLVAVQPDTHDLWLFENGSFSLYQPINSPVTTSISLTELIETSQDNLPVYEWV
ncbi:MAG: DUF2309 domain-containing protein [Spirosomaceae bacterium]|jgi:hypothetical protein|nr:DUF2309 domain-containing protein [Spirosomataceae bacterium]